MRLSCLLATLFLLAPGTARAADAPKVGDTVGKLKFTDIRSLPRTLDDFGKKKAVVLVFVNTTCPVAQRYLPTLQALEKEYRDRGTTMDLWLRWKGHFVSEELAFELKVNLKRKADCDRLIGQIEDLNPRENLILLVLIGETDHALLGRLREKYAEQIKPSVGFDAKLSIVQIAPSEEAP